MRSTDSREPPVHCVRDGKARGDSARWEWFLAALRVPVRALAFLFHRHPTSPSRRAFLQGRLWKFIPPARFAPLVTRLPPSEKLGDERVHDAGKPRSIGGIHIDPVPPTDLGNKSAPRTMPVFRPPGAIDEFQFLAGCTRCGDCISACPHQAIRTAGDRFGQVAGTPIIEPDVQACLMCEDFPCITSCDPGVLTRSIPPVMGTARVTQQLCLAYHNTTCTVCSERCPVEDAIDVRDGKPTINENTCTGCGVCRYVCPAPGNAILLMPAFARPGLPTP